MFKLQNRIKEARLKKGLSQKKLADIIGTSQQQIDLLEKSERKISIEWLDKLSKGLDVAPTSLLPAEWSENTSEAELDKGLLTDIIVSINDILLGKSLTPQEKAKLILILYEEYHDLPCDSRKEKIIEFSKLYMKAKSA